MIDVATLHAVSIEEAIAVSAKDWKTPADWPVFAYSKLNIWNVRIGVPERHGSTIPKRPYWTPGKGGALTDSEIRDHLPDVVAKRLLELLPIISPPVPIKKRKAKT